MRDKQQETGTIDHHHACYWAHEQEDLATAKPPTRGLFILAGNMSLTWEKMQGPLFLGVGWVGGGGGDPLLGGIAIWGFYGWIGLSHPSCPISSLGFVR